MSDLPAVQRPNGKLYRPRKIVVHCWDNFPSGYGEDCGVVVLGTHDIDRARPLAEEWSRYWHNLPYVVDASIGWFRDCFVRNDRAWVPDPDRGRAGVWFTASDDPEETS